MRDTVSALIYTDMNLFAKMEKDEIYLLSIAKSQISVFCATIDSIISPLAVKALHTLNLRQTYCGRKKLTFNRAFTIFYIS
jgi:hypothetical protein